MTTSQTNTTTLAAEYARQGKSWEQELNQRAVEIKKLQELGLTSAEDPPEEEEEEPVEARATAAPKKKAAKKKVAKKKATKKKAYI